jgi:membrane-bound lytic murein transglycosylase F
MKGSERFYINSFCISLLVLSISFSYTLDQWKQKSKNVNISIYENSSEDLLKVSDLQAETIDLPSIHKRGKLIALAGYSPHSYFVYRGTPMGFEHDLLQLLAKHLGVSLEIIIIHNHDELLEKLIKGEKDLVADNLIVTRERDRYVDFTDPIMTTRQVLVQKKPEKSQRSGLKDDQQIIRSPLQLVNKNVHVRKGSAFYERLQHLSHEIGEDICIIEEPGDCGTEELIRQVSEGKIPFTVADEETALIQLNYYSNIDVHTAIGFEQKVAWAVREDSPLLLKEVNSWLEKIKKEKSFDRIYRRYYIERKGEKENARCTKLSFCGRRISPYDELIMTYAKDIGWDWRLLASLIYQESQFNPKAKSWAGASGLMQLMPATAEAFGAFNPEDPHESLKAGTKYLKWLEKYWEKKVPDKEERLKFILASYNVGQEHVADAQRLAEKYCKDPSVWDDNVAWYLLQKSDEKYCKDPVVKYGYCRGKEPFEYVNNILSRYEHYKKLIREGIHAQGTDTSGNGKS